MQILAEHAFERLAWERLYAFRGWRATLCIRDREQILEFEPISILLGLHILFVQKEACFGNGPDLVG